MTRHIKTVTVRIFEPGNKIARTRRCVALKGQHWTEHGIQQLLEYMASEIEKVMPLEEYELVELNPSRFNFVHRGVKTIDVDMLPEQPMDPHTAELAMRQRGLALLRGALPKEVPAEYITGEPTEASA